MRIGSLFSGYGGLEMGVQSVLGGTTAWVSDIDPGACKILAHRYPAVPNLGDIKEVRWETVEPVDVLAGGFPCQDVSHAGKRAGLRPDTRSGLWSQMAYAIDTLRPRLVVAENVRGLLSAEAHSDVEQCAWCVGGAADGEPALRALGAVLGDLADLGYDARWVGLRAADVGAPHGRFRVFVVAEDADGAARGERRVTASGPAARGWTWADTRGRGGAPAADSQGDGRDEGWTEPAGLVGGPDAPVGRDAAADASRERHGRGEDGGGLGRLDAEDAGGARERERSREVAGDRGAATLADADSDGLKGVRWLDPAGCDADGRRRADTAWGDYEPAVRRWERVLGRPAPAPTEPGKTGPRLSPRFVEWMMGLPAGHVTDVPGITRNEALKALGNGVVPQQAAAALRVALGVRAVAA